MTDRAHRRNSTGAISSAYHRVTNVPLPDVLETLLLASPFLILLNGLPTYVYSLGYFDPHPTRDVATHLVQNWWGLKVPKYLALALALVLIFLIFITHYEEIEVPLPTLAIPLVAWLGFAFARSLVTAHPLIAMGGLRPFAPMVLVVAAYSIVGGTFADRFRRWTVILGIAAVLLSVPQVFIDHGSIFYNKVDLWLFTSKGRVFSLFNFPNNFAGFLVFFLAFLAVDERIGFRIKAILVAVSLVLILLTGAVTGGMALAALTVAYLMYGGRGLPQRRVLIPTAALAGVLFVVLFPQLLDLMMIALGRGPGFNTISARPTLVGNALEALGPAGSLIGAGLGIGSSTALGLKSIFGVPHPGPVYTPDSLVLTLIGQVGIIGLVLFTALFWIGWRRAVAIRHTNIGMLGTLLIPTFAAISLGTPTFEFFPLNWITWITIGLVLREWRVHTPHKV